MQDTAGPAIPLAKRTAPETIGRYDWYDAAIPVNGRCDPNFSAYDQAMTGYLREVGAPGGALSVYYKDTLVYSKGFGWADVDAHKPFTPQTSSRISSLSKLFTKWCIEDMIEYGQLEPDAKVVDILKRGAIVPLAPKGKEPDPRIVNVTIRQLLDHRSGIRPGLDLMECMSDSVIKSMGFSKPIQSNDAASYILGMPLDSDPGEKEQYSNFGYTLLGHVIEVISGKSYEAAIKDRVMNSKVNTSHWFVTNAMRGDRRDYEADYYSTRSYTSWDRYRLDVCAGAAGWVAPTEGLADFFRKQFPGRGWHFTFFGSYTGAIAVMKVHDNGLVFVANVNYRRGNDSADNDVLFKAIEDVSLKLNLP